MAEFKSVREIAAEMVAAHRRKQSGMPPRMPLPEQVVEAAIQMETLNAKDRDWLERIGIKV